MRYRFVMRGGRLVPWTPAPVPAARSELPAPLVQSDIAPYRSMRTGEMITGRAQHREHLHRYDLLEVGNERVGGFSQPRPMLGPVPGEIAEDIRRELQRDPGERRGEATQVLHDAGYDGPAVDRILSH